MRVALVHDWLTGMRGGERCLEALASLLPKATPIYTLFADRGLPPKVLRGHSILTSPLQRLYDLAPGRYRALLPLFPWALRALERQLRKDGADLVLSVSHCVAKAARVSGARHVTYCLTPMRYAWQPGGYGWRQTAAAPLLAWLRRWDWRTSGHLDEVVAISREVAGRVERGWGLPASVVYPPVDCGRFAPLADAPGPGAPYLVVSALVPYKRVDLAVEACTRLGRRLDVIGEGPERRRLERLAGPTVRFLGWRSDGEVARRLEGCRALLFPGHEDFGIVPVEALAAGRPVIAYGRGGALETVTPSCGVIFPGIGDLTAAIERFEATEASFDPATCRARALRFDRPVFLRAWAERLAGYGVRVPVEVPA